MNPNDFEEKWKKIEALPREGDHDLIRISSECHAEISLAISPENQRCLILALPENFSFDFRPVEREKLSLTMVQNKNYVAMTLLNDDFVDLFNNLIISMHNSIKDIQDVESYAKEFVRTFHKWAQFFDPKEGNLMADSVIQGIFGEMIYLRNLLHVHPPSDVNRFLESWRGPYDQGPDFILEDKDIEVKTRMNTNTSVRITTETQLDQLEGKGLELAVVVVDRNNPNGLTLKELTEQIIALITDSLGDISILYKAMSQKNLGPTNLSDYDHLSFMAQEITNYDCLASSFPRVVRSELPDALFGFKYSLNTSEIEEFKVREVTL